MEFGTPRKLPHCEGWILERQIPGFPFFDAMGCYPLFACQDWSQLQYDLAELGQDLVSLSLVTDPFGKYDEACLHQCFKDVVVPFKDHFVVDLSRPRNEIVSKHHRYYARKALKDVDVERCEGPMSFLDDWLDLYATLIRRHDIKGIPAFSRTAFARQMETPGLVMLRAVSRGTTVGAHLWYVQGEVAYSHLAAFSPLGYELIASYALYWFAIDYFVGKVAWLNLGASAGIKHEGADGLSQFKRGWSTGTRPAYFCGRVFEKARYKEIVSHKTGLPNKGYFPLYRYGEF